MGTFVHWQCSVPLGVMNCECPIHTNNCWQGSCSSSCAPEPVPSPPQFKLPQPVKNTQNSLPWIATSVWEVSVPTEPMLCVRLCAWYIACFPVFKTQRNTGDRDFHLYLSVDRFRGQSKNTNCSRSHASGSGPGMWTRFCLVTAAYWKVFWFIRLHKLNNIGQQNKILGPLMINMSFKRKWIILINWVILIRYPEMWNFYFLEKK